MKVMKAMGVAALTAIGVAANAVLLVPGGAGMTNGSYFDVVDTLAMTGPIAVTGTNAQSEVKFTGTLYNNVYKLSNGNLLFSYWFFNDSNSQNSVSRLSMTGFTGYSVNADWSTNSLPSGPLSIYADRSSDGSTVGFQYVPSILGGNGLIAPGQNNMAVAIETNAQNFALTGSTSAIDGAVASVKTYAPAPVPEPATLAVLGVGAIGLIRRRARK